MMNRLDSLPSSDLADAPLVKNRQAVSRARILAAAIAEFAVQGFAGARVDAIAARAGINKRMLYAYVGNKEALWLAALEQVYEAKRQEERNLDLHRLSPAEGMKVLIRFNYRYHAEHPEFLAMLADENRQRGLHLHDSKRIRELYSPLLELMSSLLAGGQAEGVFRKNVDPVQLYISITGLGYFYFSNLYTLSAIFNRHLEIADEVDSREQHIVDMVMGYLRP
jgi:AcrR family transcriptional regulator